MIRYNFLTEGLGLLRAKGPEPLIYSHVASTKRIISEHCSLVGDDVFPEICSLLHNFQQTKLCGNPESMSVMAFEN